MRRNLHSGNVCGRVARPEHREGRGAHAEKPTLLQCLRRRGTVALMRITDPQTARSYVEKRRHRYNDGGEPRELTFSCYRRYPFLVADRTLEWFREALEAARSKFGFQLWAYVVMPEHVHLLVVPGPLRARDSVKGD